MLVSSMLLREMMDWKVLKLPPERVEALCFLCIWLISESSLLRVESLRFCRLVGLLLSLRFLGVMLRAGWLSFLTLSFLASGNSLTLFLKVRCEMLSLKELLSRWLMRQSRCCMDCTLNSPTNLSRLDLLSVMVISWRGRQYFKIVCSSFTTTPHLLALNEVTMQCLARNIASSMNCLWISFTVSSGFSLNASSSAAGTYWQKRSMQPPSSWAWRRFTAFLCEMAFSLSTLVTISWCSSQSLGWQRFLTRVLLMTDQWTLRTPKGNWKPFISWITLWECMPINNIIILLPLQIPATPDHFLSATGNQDLPFASIFTALPFVGQSSQSA